MCWISEGIISIHRFSENRAATWYTKKKRVPCNCWYNYASEDTAFGDDRSSILKKAKNHLEPMNKLVRGSTGGTWFISSSQYSARDWAEECRAINAPTTFSICGRVEGSYSQQRRMIFQRLSVIPSGWGRRRWPWSPISTIVVSSRRYLSSNGAAPVKTFEQGFMSCTEIPGEKYLYDGNVPYRAWNQTRTRPSPW